MKTTMSNLGNCYNELLLNNGDSNTNACIYSLWTLGSILCVLLWNKNTRVEFIHSAGNILKQNNNNNNNKKKDPLCLFMMCTIFYSMYITVKYPCPSCPTYLNYFPSIIILQTNSFVSLENFQT